MSYTNVTRLLGINSGWDTQQLVTDMMNAQSLRYTKMQKSALLIGMRQDMYRSVHADLLSFQKSYLSSTASNSLRLSSTFSTKSTSVKTSSGQASTAVSVGAGSKDGVYSIKVEKIAVADMYESASKVGGTVSSAKDFTFDASKIREDASYEITLDGASKKISFSEGDKVAGGTITFTGGSIGIKDAGGNVTQLDEQGFIDVFNEKLKSAFGTEGTGDQQKVEAQLTASGGISIFTNGYHSGFSVSDGSYNFANALSDEKSALWGKTATQDRSLGFTVSAGGSVININVAVKEGMTQQEMLDGINEQLENQGFGDKVFVHADMTTGKIKIVNFSSTDDASISDQTGLEGSMEYLGFKDASISLAPSGSLKELGITSGTSSKFDAESTLSEIFGSSLSDEGSFTINGTIFAYTGDTKMNELMDRVNNAGIGVTMRYNEFNQTFQLESDNAGYVNKIEMSGEFLTDNLGFGTTAKREAADSVATINGTTLTRSSNEYDFLGVSWKLSSVTGDEELTVSINRDADKTVDAIKNFVDGYNALVENLTGLTSASRPKYEGSYYDPLTDEEKAEMTEKEIEMWEEKSKTGLLRNDSILTSITQNLRTALNQAVTLEDGTRLSLHSIGITTSNDMSKSGQLMIDEDKLRQAIETYGDGISELFTKSSAEGGKGLAERVNDIVNNAVSAKGPISKKAGIVGTYTENNNELYSQLKAKTDTLSNMLTKLQEKETSYYNMFARMEAALASASSQSQYISSMFGGS